MAQADQTQRAEHRAATGRAGADPTGAGRIEAACSIATTLAIVGDRWTILILRDVFRGVRRFGQLQADLGIARNLLSDRLAKLVDHEVLEKVRYQSRPERFEYRLTSKGADLSTALIALMGWGDRWYAADGAPTILVHEQCDTPVEQTVRCPSCDQNLRPTDIASRPGPGRTVRRSAT